MINFGDLGKRSGDDAGGRSKRQRREPIQRHISTRNPLSSAGLDFGTPVNSAAQQTLGHAHRAKTPTAVSDPVSLYRQGRYTPTGAGHYQMPIPEFLRGVSAHGGAQQPQENDDTRDTRLSPSHETPPQLPRSGSDDRQPAADPQTNGKVVRVCPQCTVVPLGPGPVVNGEPTYPVCEKCRQANIRQQVLRGVAAQALVDLSQRVVSFPREQDDEADVRGQFLNGLGPIPKAPQQFVCLRCKRPNMPLAPGRRRCVECICILIAFGPDDSEEQARAEVNRKQQGQKPALLQQQQRRQPQDQHWHICDGCFKMPVPPGERKCTGCAAPFAPKVRTPDICVICEHKHAIEGQSYCTDCGIRGTRSLGATTITNSMVCNACGYYVDRTADGLCWGCRKSRASPGAAA